MFSRMFKALCNARNAGALATPETITKQKMIYASTAEMYMTHLTDNVNPNHPNVETEVLSIRHLQRISEIYTTIRCKKTAAYKGISIQHVRDQVRSINYKRGGPSHNQLHLYKTKLPHSNTHKNEETK